MEIAGVTEREPSAVRVLAVDSRPARCCVLASLDW